MSHHCCYYGYRLFIAHVVCPVHLVNDGQQTLLHVGYAAACFNAHARVVTYITRTEQ